MTTKTIEATTLWKEHIQYRSEETRHNLILHYIWLVKYVLQQMKIPTNSLLSEEDFINIGILGLHESISKYDLDRGVKFESYAVPRIKGTIQDELRKLDWLSRSARKKASDILEAGDQLRSETGREVSTEEIRIKLNLSEERYQTYLSAAAAAKASLSMNESSHQNFGEESDYDLIEELPDSDNQDILENLENEERLGVIRDYLKSLKEKKRHVMMLYYYENLTFKEIGTLLNVSESRVCQIHTQVVADLRIKLEEYDNA